MQGALVHAVHFQKIFGEENDALLSAKRVQCSTRRASVRASVFGPAFTARISKRLLIGIKKGGKFSTHLCITSQSSLSEESREYGILSEFYHFIDTVFL
jgi:hypothetical protein